jgi:TonB family protein
MAKPIFYKPRPKWHFLGSLIAALAVEAAAVGLASIKHEEQIPEETGLFQQQPVDAIITEEPPEPTPPPEEEEPPPPPPPDEPTEFVIQEPTPPPRPPNAPTPKPRAKVSESLGRNPTSGGPVNFVSAKANMISAPHPAYPYEARKARQTGSGKFLLQFDSAGNVTDVSVVQSTGSPILDQTSLNTFRRWRCKAGIYTKVYVPITFTMEGAQL